VQNKKIIKLTSKNLLILFRFQFSDSHVQRCRSRKMFGGAKDFCTNIPKLSWKAFVRLFPTNFSKIMRPFFGWDHTKTLLLGVSSKKEIKVFMCFFGFGERHARILFSGFCPIFRQNKTFGGALEPPSTPPHTPLLLFLFLSYEFFKTSNCRQ